MHQHFRRLSLSKVKRHHEELLETMTVLPRVLHVLMPLNWRVRVFLKNKELLWFEKNMFSAFDDDWRYLFLFAD